MKRFILIVAIAVMALHAQAQESVLLDSVELALAPEFLDLEEALKQPDRVVKLTLRKKKYKSFPKEILMLRNLQFLDLSRNDIKELPDSIVRLQQLQYLNLSRNGLERLPLNIGQMKNLRWLNVNQNELVKLPYSFGELENLMYADLWSNNLDYFPETMKNLKKLKRMDLRNILISKEKQESLQSALPNTKIYFSPPCNCGL